MKLLNKKEAHIFKVDVTDESSIQGLVDTLIQNEGRLDASIQMRDTVNMASLKKQTSIK